MVETGGVNMRDEMDVNGLSASTIIQVVGPAGSGKSFFARQFSKTMGSPMISRDRIRWTLFAHHTYSEDEDSIVNQVSDMMFDEMLKTKKLLVLDGGCNTRLNRAEILRKASQNKYRIITVVVQTDVQTARARSMKRSSRGIDDRYKQSMTKAQYDEQLKTYEQPQIDKNTVVISGKHTYSTQVRTVLKKIVELQGAPAATVEAAKARTTSTARSLGPFIQ